ncbi:MAG TPA: aminopeptidase P family N-terminal domain-containing protein, partial [Xanthobacteraceae bacterium]
MRRGLILRSPAELPDAVLDARIARVHAAMGDARLDALLLYTNNTRPAGVSWLTGFVPYWSEALLVLPRGRPPALVVALTYRVKSWIERTSRVAEVVHSPRIGLEAARMIAGWKADATVGIADLDGLSAGIAGDLREGGPRLALGDATALFAGLRAAADPAEIALAIKAATIARRALARASERRAGLAETLAAVEAEARGLGAEEVYLAAAPDLARDHRLRRVEGEAALGARFALRATVAYQGTWIRLLRTFRRDAGAGADDGALARMAAAVAELPGARGFSSFSSWLIEGCLIAQPLEPLLGSRVDEPRTPPPHALVSVQASFES